VVEKRPGYHGANSVAASVLWSRLTRPVPEEPRYRIVPTRFQGAAEDVAVCHGPILAHHRQFDCDSCPGEEGWRCLGPALWALGIDVLAGSPTRGAASLRYGRTTLAAVTI
jgi:hypothetical protein